jgi:hypothetical protein
MYDAILFFCLNSYSRIELTQPEKEELHEPLMSCKTRRAAWSAGGHNLLSASQHTSYEKQTIHMYHVYVPDNQLKPKVEGISSAE